MRERYEKNKEGKYLLCNKKEIIGIDFYEDELEPEFIRKKNIRNSYIPANAKPKFIDVNIPEGMTEEGSLNYIYNPISHIKNDDEVFEIADIILKNSNNNTPGVKLLLCTLIFYVVKFRPIKEQNLRYINELTRTVYSPFKQDDEMSGMDYLMNIVADKEPHSIVAKLYAGFKALAKEEQDRIAVLLFETLLPFQLRKYDRFNSEEVSYIDLKTNEFPCFMLYLEDYEESKEDRMMAEVFAIQQKRYK